MCLKKFWGCKPKVAQVLEEDFGEDEAKSRILDLERRGIKSDNLRIVGLSKVFHHYGLGIKSKLDINAVKPTYLEVENNEMLTLLGHNGAGKSTLIGMLTGILTPTGGYASVGGYNILDKIDDARKLLGVCPQHDILWDELTAREHLMLFAKLKGIEGKAQETQIEEKLIQVNLVQEADSPVGTYSGGMKRRLSVAISGIGDPKIIIMDEPTTGMDPINKREVWKLIQNLKQGRIIILTTHSMEEADILSDRVAVIVEGRIKCQGTSLHLKNTYGDGYRISLVTRRPEQLIRMVYQLLPSCKVIDESAGSVVVAVPLAKMDEIKRFTR
jgi:ABC-type multidrug transport system ATPase subunit